MHLRNALAPAAVTVSLLAVTDCSSSSDTTSPTTTSTSITTTAPDKASVEVILADFTLTPPSLVAPTGLATFKVRNDGQAPHSFAIKTADGKSVGQTKDLNPGQTEDLNVELPAGQLVTYCSVPGHESLGMKGDLLVS